MRSTRAASQAISTSISTLAAQDLELSEDKMDVTLVNTTSEYEGQPYYADFHSDDSEGEGDDDSEEEEDEGSNSEEGESEGEDEDEEDDDGDPVTVPSKRKHGRPKQQQKAEQLNKPRSSRGVPISRFFNLYSNKLWTTLKSRIRTSIRAALNLAELSLDDFHVTFTVPHQVTSSIQLNNIENYDHLVKNAMKIKTSPSAKILIEPQQSRTEKENDDTVRNERDILPANVALNAKIGALRERWKCPAPAVPCGSEHCFVHPDEPDHFPLSHAHMESWGAAMLKGEEFATINKPPNNELFDKLSAQALAACSPLLQRRLELNKKAAVNNAPQININFLPELVGLFGRPPAPAPAPAPVAGPAPAANGSTMLIPWALLPVPAFRSKTFCMQYDLDDDISARFQQFRFKKTDSFAYITLAQLTKMEFMPGEIAELQVAIAQWSPWVCDHLDHSLAWVPYFYSLSTFCLLP
ncbi:hypothetical protein MVEN_00113700 [Mycena venus]|uniref:Uncharacterized protein n=1 Tax=Mycena venus TaxID=2733690 RepID=A0A8H6Z555_9AGAR|nr:hypothetical protein MVEN_00113700 [Mycena venus]